MKIGIVGAESTHSVNYAKLVNVLGLVKDCEVTHIWGEEESFAKRTAENGAIPNIVNNPKEMIGKIDGVIIAHRRGNDHIEPANLFIENKIPIFVDKPISFHSSDALSLISKAEQNKTPITTFSNTILQDGFQKIKSFTENETGIFNISTHGFCDINSPYEGIYFYGIHHVYMILNTMGYDISQVYFQPHLKSSPVVFLYEDGRSATLHFMDEGWKKLGFHLTVSSSSGVKSFPVTYDEYGYLKAITTAAEMFKTKIMPFSKKEMVAPIYVLEKCNESAQLQKPVKVNLSSIL